jgi:hypothetical protein
LRGVKSNQTNTEPAAGKLGGVIRLRISAHDERNLRLLAEARGSNVSQTTRDAICRGIEILAQETAESL